MPTPSNALTAKLMAAWPPERWRDVTVLIAVSGGADSVALARSLTEIRASGDGRLVLAHFNHQLRGIASDEDQTFVEVLARELGLAVIVGARGGDRESEGDGARASSQNSEESLRLARYSFLAATADQCGARYVATAHTADDQVETVLFNVIRGAGWSGLAGIPRVRPFTDAASLMRPMLDVTRAEVLAYLNALKQPFREDATNFALDYTRNRIRHELLPLLEREFNPQVRDAVLRLTRIAAETEEFLDQEARNLLDVAGRPITRAVELDVMLLKSSRATLARRALMLVWSDQGWPLQDMSFEKWEQLLHFAIADDDQKPSPQFFPGGVRAERTGGFLRLTKP